MIQIPQTIKSNRRKAATKTVTIGLFWFLFISLTFNLFVHFEQKFTYVALIMIFTDIFLSYLLFIWLYKMIVFDEISIDFDNLSYRTAWRRISWKWKDILSIDLGYVGRDSTQYIVLTFSKPNGKYKKYECTMVSFWPQGAKAVSDIIKLAKQECETTNKSI